MLRKALYTGSFFVLAALVIFFVLRQFQTQAFPIYQDNASWEGKSKMALIRLEDVSPGTYNTKESLEKLEAIADYLYQEGVPFQVSIIPVYKDPGKNVEISIGDTDNPQVRDFIKTIKYMRGKGGKIGLHGYTHQYQKEITGSGFEFMEKGTSTFATPGYAGERAGKALELMDKAGIPVDYWETPHYTATLDQYRVLSKYFGLIYDPNPADKKFKNISSWDSTGFDNESAVFIPAPLLNVTKEKDVNRILAQLDKNDPVQLASFFFHPYLEFKSMYKMKAKEGYEFYAYETDSYLHRLIGGFKERGYRFVSVYDLIGFLPAQRLFNFYPANGGIMLTGDVDGDGRSDFISGDPASGRWLVVRSRIERLIPRNALRSFGQPEEWLSNWGRGGATDFVAGDYNGDGTKDLACRDGVSGEIMVALSDGSKFIPQQQPWVSYNNPNGPVKVLAGHFNSNEREDLLFWVEAESTAYVAISSGSGFSQAGVWLKNWQDVESPLIFTGDFSGDGKDDLAALDRKTGAIKLMLNDGSGFTTTMGENNQMENFVAGEGWQVMAGDLTGDGIDDFSAYDAANGRWEFILSGNSHFYRESWPLIFGKGTGGKALVGDFNGDNKNDLAAARYFTNNQSAVDTAISVINTAGAP
ncbi:DUF2334 domain-containing protein [Pelotomaculum propionicicum]|uniref:DUF2334 domain-containing protein n=1 Tax=Pelotomaculum propionicicum TaxID=258475 RepID=UPI003B7D7501